MDSTNDGFRFVLELAVLASVAYWGFSSHDGIVQWILGIGGPMLIAVGWVTFVNPNGKQRLGDPSRLLLELAIFGAGVGALAGSDGTGLAVGLGLAVAVHLGATFVLGQR
jgi:hypothetical protein